MAGRRRYVMDPLFLNKKLNRNLSQQTQIAMNQSIEVESVC